MCFSLPSVADEGSENIPLGKYKPIYFLSGTPYTKIQLSFKVQLIPSMPVYFAYNQLMLWDLFRSSPYFYDLNYNPLIFYRLKIDHKESQWVDFIPLEHESNGKGEMLERAWDRVAVAYHFESLIGDSSLLWDFKAWLPIRYNSGNQDITHYRGYGEVSVIWSRFLGGKEDPTDLIFRIYPGGSSGLNPLQGGQELTFRTKSVIQSFIPQWMVQLFHGYGEYLLDYNQSHWGLRVGLGF
jgi:phospholipase A1